MAFFIFSVAGFSASAQNISNKGKDFWVGYGFHQYMQNPADNSQNMTLYISVEGLPVGVPYATVTITIDSSGLTPGLWWKRVYHIAPYTVLSLDNNATPAFSASPATALTWGPLPKGPAPAATIAADHTSPNFDCRLYTDPCPAGTGGFGLFRKKGIHITGDYDIVAYAHTYGGVSSGATMLLPTNSWGYSYTTINSKQINAGGIGYNFFYVMAYEDSTRVKITGSATPRATGACTFTPPTPGTPFIVNLNKGQIFQYIGDADNGGNGVELTGSRVESVPNAVGKCKKVAVFAGSARTRGEDDCGTGSGRDNDMQQCFPEHTWGRRYATSQFANAGGSTNLQPNQLSQGIYKIVAKDAGTLVTINGGAPIAIPLGSSYRFSNSTANLIVSNNPIAVAQFMSGACQTGLGDPEMIYLSPIEQSISQVGFYRNTQESIQANFVNIIIPDSGLAKLRIDGALNPWGGNSYVYNHPNLPGYKVVVKGWAAAKAQTIISSNARFNAITYGLGNFESYGYSGGAYFNNVSAVSAGENVYDPMVQHPDSIRKKNHDYTFDRSPFQLKTAVTFQPRKIEWILSRMIDTSKVSISRVCDGVKNTNITDTTSGGYIYTAPYGFVGRDTFYIKGCDESGANCVNQIHIVTVGTPFAGNNTTVNQTTALNTNILASASAEIAPTGGTNPYTYAAVDKSGSTKNTSNKLGILNIIATTGAYSYKPPVGFTGKDTFYLKVCDASLPTNCIIQMHIVVVGSLLVGDTIAISNAAAVNTPVNGSASSEINPTGGTTPYTYQGVNSTNVASVTSVKGAAILVNATTGAYTYTPTTGFTGTDTFYVRICDASSIASCLTQMHIISVGAIFAVTTTTLNQSSAINKTLKGYASVEINPTGGLSPYTYQSVNSVGAVTTTSNNGGSISVVAGNGIYYYNPITGFLGTDTFYIKVCDASATANCATQMHIVTVSSLFAGNTSTVNNITVKNVQTTGNASTEIAPTGGISPYKYKTANASSTPSLTSNNGGVVSVDSITGKYKYTPKSGFIGTDTFYIRVCDSSIVVNCLLQMHTVTVNDGFSNSIAPNAQINGNAAAETNVIIKPNQYFFKNVNSFGVQTGTSSQGGVVSMVPGVIDTISKGQDTFYVYRAPTCDYVFNKKDTTQKIDSVYIPIVIYSKPITGIPVGCYGAGGLIGDTVNLLFKVYPRPRTDFGYFLGACSSDSVKFSSDTVSANIPAFKYKIIKWLWKFPDGTTSSQQNPKHLLPLGNNDVTLIIVVENGGIDSLKKTVVVSAAAPVKFGMSSPAVCLGQSITVTDSTNSASKDSCYWDFGDGIKVIDKTCNPLTHTYTVKGTYIIRHTLVITGASCPIDTVQKTVLVSDKAFVDFVSPTSCIDTSGIANFSYNGPLPINSFKWKFGEPSTGALDSSSIDPTTHKYAVEGDYTVKLNVVNGAGCPGDTSKVVTIKILPNIYFNALSNRCENTASFSLNSFAGCYNQTKVLGSGIFKGDGVDASGNFSPALAGAGMHTIWYVYTSGKGCMDSLSRNITVYAKPHADFDWTKGCLPKNGVAQFSNLSSIATGYNLSGFSWNFSDPNATTSNPNIVDSLNPSHIFKNTGSYNVKLIDTSADGCLGDTTITITFSVTPDVKFTALSSVCENATNVNVAFGSVANGVLGTGSYFGNGTTTVGVLSPAVSGYGNQTITYVFTSTGNCIDSASQTILVKARPKIGFSYPAGCLPANGIVKFTDTTKISDGQTIQSCGWTFGDPNATVSNPNTASICSPTHNFNYGTYTIYHTVTSSLGCVTDTTFTANFSVSPDLYFNAIPAVCENLTTYSVANAGSNNLAAAPGTGVYQGTGITNANTGDFNPSIAGPGTHEIYYVFTATSGCVARDTQTVVIKDRPKGQFTFTPNTGCLNATGTVQFDASAIAVQGSTIQSYNWQFETPSTIVNGMSPTHNYNDGTYTISLNVKANNGCSFDTSMSQTFSKTPALNPLVQADVCENGGVVTLTAPSITNGAIGTGSFSSFKNAVTNATTGSYDPSIAGYGTDTIYYAFTSTAGCVATVKTAVNIKARPRGGFTFSPNTGCLNATGLVQFNNNMSVQGSTIQSYNWQFETPSTIVNGTSPTHNYNDGTYTISLNVQANNGCNFDTSMSQTFSKTPSLNPLVQADICENGGVVTLTAPSVTNGAIGTGAFSSFKNAVTNATTGSYDPSIAGYGTDTIYYTFTSTGGCVAAVKTAVNIKARPRGGFTFSPNTGCLNATGLVQFSNNMSVQGSTIQSYNWQFETPSTVVNGTSPTHNYNDGTYTISLNVQANNGCSFDTSMSQTFSKTPSLSPLVQAAICENGGVVTLTAPSVTNGAIGTGAFSSFKNAVTNATTGSYDPSIAGYGSDTIYYTFTSTGGCVASVKTAVNIKARPRGGFTFSPNTGCLNAAGFVQFNNNIFVLGSSVQAYNWQFETPSTVVNGSAPTHNYNDGTYTISLNVIGANGCSFDTSMSQTFSKTPALSPLVQAAICENGGVVTLTAPSVTNGAVGTGVFSSFKNAVTNAIAGTYDPSIAGYGVDTIYYKFTSTGGCTAERKLAVTIKARPRGQFSFTPNTGCLDVTGLVKFNAGGISVPGSFVQTYNWQFENTLPFISGGANPTHSYSDGTYDIKLNAIGFNGCSFDTMMTQKFSRTPSLDPIVLANVCANSSAFTLTAPAVNNGVTGNTGVFSSLKNAIINNTTYDPAIAGYSIDTVYYTFTSYNGCVATVKKFINILPVPKAVISVKPNVCIDSTITFKDLSTLASGTINTRNWNFGDGSIAVVNPAGNTIAHNFANTQSYIVHLTVTSDSGCVNTDSVNITVRPKPVAFFEHNPVVCMPSGTAFFTNKSSLTPLVGGTMSYAWTFGDPNANASNPNTSIATDPKHTYSTIQSYPVRLVVTSKPYNCIDIYDDTLFNKKPFFLKPVAKFGVSKDTLCENEPSLFTDSSFAPNSSLFSWTWYYGDGSTPNTTTVPYSSYSYPAADTFRAALTVRNTELCESDPYYLKVLVYPQPQIDSMKEIIVLQNTVLQFNPTISDSIGIRYWWTAFLPPYSVAGLSNPDSLRPYLNATQSQIYVLNAVGQGQCKAQRIQSVKVLGKIIIPNAFSPNGDGINDTWKITSLGDYPGATLDIFDRYGMKVKHLEGNMEWDGTLNGSPMPVATYYYIINPGNGVAQFTGWVVLLR